MELFWAAGFVFAVIFVIVNAMARDWSNPYFWLILLVLAIMGADFLR
jgi:hypothetical protein